MMSTGPRLHLTGGFTTALAAVLLLTGCSSGGEAPAPPAIDTSWSFTDDLGRTTTLDARPERIAGLNDPLAVLWSYGIAPVASFGYPAITEDRCFADLSQEQDAEAITPMDRTSQADDLDASSAVLSASKDVA